MLRPRTVLRLLLYFGLSWLVLALLYVGLPNYTRIDNGIDYATSVLQSGGKLTRVYAVDEYFRASGAAEFSANNEPRSNIVLTFRVDKASKSLIICDTGRVSLANPTDLTPAQEQESENDDFVHLKTPIVVPAPAGDTDGINLPWFETADAVLLFYLIHRDRALVKLQAGFTEGGRKLEVWAGGDDWTSPQASQNNHPLLSLTIDNPDNSPNLISSASVPLLSTSPSPSYPIRLIVLLLLAPISILCLGLYMGIIVLIYAVLNLVVRLFWIIVFSLLISWLYKGRPSADEFVQAVISDVAGVLRRVRGWFGRTVLEREGDEEQLPSNHPSLRDEKVAADGSKRDGA